MSGGRASRDMQGGEPVGRDVPSIGIDDVAHVARLARLHLTQEELERFTGQLAQVLEHARDIAALHLDDVEPTAHPQPLRNVLRPDRPEPCLERDVVLAAAPEVEDGRFSVPPVLGEAP